MVSRVNLKLQRPYLLAVARPTPASVTRSRAPYYWPPEGPAPSSKRERFAHSARRARRRTDISSCRLRRSRASARELSHRAVTVAKATLVAAASAAAPALLLLRRRWTAAALVRPPPPPPPASSSPPGRRLDRRHVGDEAGPVPSRRFHRVPAAMAPQLRSPVDPRGRRAYGGASPGRSTQPPAMAIACCGLPPPPPKPGGAGRPARDSKDAANPLVTAQSKRPGTGPSVRDVG
ncbi:hypothetical protein QYE76_047938 [Lolium multiflorum]|uniref:Uncharacterized protein n=1 Tax=Lolium multiflorum TaxID=4521 RepID=A0AAD8X026_LOLMU|nr:hypothetical protein QYE76_047938 [Lolium multiflorum]